MKKQVNYVVEESVKDTFNQVAKLNALNKSQWLENAMIEYIKTHSELDSFRPVAKYIKGV